VRCTAETRSTTGASAAEVSTTAETRAPHRVRCSATETGATAHRMWYSAAAETRAAAHRMWYAAAAETGATAHRMRCSAAAETGAATHRVRCSAAAPKGMWCSPSATNSDPASAAASSEWACVSSASESGGQSDYGTDSGFGHGTLERPRGLSNASGQMLARDNSRALRKFREAGSSSDKAFASDRAFESMPPLRPKRDIALNFSTPKLSSQTCCSTPLAEPEIWHHQTE
jgi:hypothetical protein